MQKKTVEHIFIILILKFLENFLYILNLDLVSSLEQQLWSCLGRLLCFAYNTLSSDAYEMSDDRSEASLVKRTWTDPYFRERSLTKRFVPARALSIGPDPHNNLVVRVLYGFYPHNNMANVFHNKYIKAVF